MPAYANPSGPLPPDLVDYFKNFGDTNAGLWSFLGNRGMGGQDIKSRYAQQQSGRYYNNYLGQVADNPGRGFFDYLNQQVDPNADFARASDLEKGYAPSNVMAPRGRWIIR